MVVWRRFVDTDATRFFFQRYQTSNQIRGKTLRYFRMDQKRNPVFLSCFGAFIDVEIPVSNFCCLLSKCRIPSCPHKVFIICPARFTCINEVCGNCSTQSSGDGVERIDSNYPSLVCSKGKMHQRLSTLEYIRRPPQISHCFPSLYLSSFFPS